MPVFGIPCALQWQSAKPMGWQHVSSSTVTFLSGAQRSARTSSRKQWRTVSLLPRRKSSSRWPSPRYPPDGELPKTQQWPKQRFSMQILWSLLSIKRRFIETHNQTWLHKNVYAFEIKEFFYNDVIVVFLPSEMVSQSKQQPSSYWRPFRTILCQQPAPLWRTFTLCCLTVRVLEYTCRRWPRWTASDIRSWGLIYLKV